MNKEISKIENYVESINKIRSELSKFIVGQHNVIDFILTALLAEGHVLIEGVPGLGKTMIIKTLSQILDLKFSRIQFTPDLIPSDLLGASIVTQNESNKIEMVFEKGPIFANLILADEINRASPKTQSALLEAMQEKTVTVRGIKYEIASPFLVLATQNPLEMEGTYPLPEAQIDRFLFKIFIKQPSNEELVSILEKTTEPLNEKPEIILDANDLLEIQKIIFEIVVDPNVKEFVVSLISAIQPENPNAKDIVKKYFRYGAGPRGAQALIMGAKAYAFMSGRLNVTIDDVKKVVKPALRHRIALNFEGQSEGINNDTVIEDIIKELLSEKKGYSFIK